MNCRNFEDAIDDLTRGALMEARSREDAHAHAEGCARCGARLADERALTAGLRTLAADAKPFAAPARVEAALLASFRARHASAGHEHVSGQEEAAPLMNVTAHVAPARMSKVAAWWMPRWAQVSAVAAASMLLVFGLYGVVRKQSNPTPGGRASNPVAGAQKSGATPEELKRRQHAGGETASATTTATTTATATPDDEIDGGDQPSRVDALPTQRRGARAPVVKAPYQYAGYNSGKRPPSAANNIVAAADSADAEITTEFIPLMNGGRLTHGDAGHVMRVELPRSALASFGLPVNADRAEARVKADVLMGEDGIARAIRFVR